MPGRVPLEKVGPKRRDDEVVGGLRHVKQRQNAQQFGEVGGLDTFLRTVAVRPPDLCAGSRRSRIDRVAWRDAILDAFSGMRVRQPLDLRTSIMHRGSVAFDR